MSNRRRLIRDHDDDQDDDQEDEDNELEDSADESCSVDDGAYSDGHQSGEVAVEKSIIAVDSASKKPAAGF